MNIDIEETGKNITEKDLDSVENKIGKKLPEEYRNFLLLYNGGRPTPSDFKIQWSEEHDEDLWINEYGTVHFFTYIDFDKMPRSSTKFFQCVNNHIGRIPDDTIPIAYDPGGNLILIGTDESNRGKIFFWSSEFESEEDDKPDYSNVGFVANTFNEFIKSLYNAEEE